METVPKNQINIGDLRVRLYGYFLTENNHRYKQFDKRNGDSFSIDFFPTKPDISASLDDLSGVRDFYRQMLCPNGIGLLQCDVVEFCGMLAVSVVVKVRLEPTGLAFIGSYTIPRLHHSFVLKFQSAENGPTGVRETMVMAMHSDLEFDETTGKMIGRAADPYDATVQFPLMRNLADDEKYDSEFPDHPLTKTRLFMRELRKHVSISDRYRQLPPFTP